MIIGLPYANMTSPELQERLKYISWLEDQRQQGSAKTAARELYENMCMSSVNQSIGMLLIFYNSSSN